MDNANMGGVIGSLLGILGGVVGTYFSIKNTNDPRERHFVIGAAIVCWFALGLAAGLLFLLPQWRAWSWVPLCALVVVGVPYLNWRQGKMRREEGGS